LYVDGTTTNDSAPRCVPTKGAKKKEKNTQIKHKKKPNKNGAANSREQQKTETREET